MKHNKGVTIIELVVVIIILVILAVIAIWSTANTVRKAEAASVFTEFKAVYNGAIQLQNFYNAETLEEYRIDHEYCNKFQEDGKTWYIIYGLNHKDDKIASGDRYSDEVIKNWGVDELKRSYEVTLDGEIKIRLYNNEYVTVGGYIVRSYDDILTLQESGAV